MTASGVVDLNGTITVPEAARFAGLHPETVKRWLREGKLRGQKVGLVWFIDAASLRSVLDVQR